MVQPIAPLISLILVLPLVGFWLWMFWHMTKNESLPDNSAVLLTWPPSSKYNWTLLFIFLNVFAAAFYYRERGRRAPDLVVGG